jgi:uroporphyrinogen-III decarboxylase
MGKLGCDFVDIDYPVDVKLARAETGPEQTLAGNLDPVRDVRNGSPETILQALKILRQQTGQVGLPPQGARSFAIPRTRTCTQW